MRVTAPVARSMRLSPQFALFQQVYGRSKPLVAQIAAASTAMPPQAPVGTLVRLTTAFVAVSISATSEVREAVTQIRDPSVVMW
jgi:hypothetical protein